MELQGRIIKLLPLRSGVSQSGKAWQSLDAVLEMPGQYPKKMVFTVFGEDRIKKSALFEGMECNVLFDIDAHEFNGKWYNSITAYNIVNTGVAVQQPQTQPVPQTVIYPDRQQPASPPINPETGETHADDLPF